MDDLVPFDLQDEHTSVHGKMIKNYLMCVIALINNCLAPEMGLTISFIIYDMNDK